MKKNFTKVLPIASLVFCSLNVFAAGGFTPLAYDTKSLSMGGVGIATSFGAQSALENPALMAFEDENELSLGVNYIEQPRSIGIGSNFTWWIGDNRISGLYDFNFNGDNKYKLSFSSNYKVVDNLHIGLALSNSELNARFTDPLELSYLYDLTLKRRRVILPVAYKIEDFACSISLIQEKQSWYGTIDDGGYNYSSIDYGYGLGLAYKLRNIGLTFGLNYKSAIHHTLTNNTGVGELNSAAEMGAGVEWMFLENNSIAVDYKRVYSSKIYKDYTDSFFVEDRYKDQNVFSIGYAYKNEKWSGRVGYSHISDIFTQSGIWMVGLTPYALKEYYTAGGSYNINKSFSLDMAFMYAKGNQTLVFPIGDAGFVYDINSKRKELSLSVNYSF